MSDNPFVPTVCKFSLNGKNYTWREPVRANSRMQRAAILRLSAKGQKELNKAKAAGGAIKNVLLAAFSQEATADIMDFFTEFHDEVRDDTGAIWDALDAGTMSDRELVEAYQKIAEFVTAPFVLAVQARAAVSASNGTTKMQMKLNPATTSD